MSGLLGFISLFAIWLTWEFLHKRVAKDELRNELFKIRHELFMLAANKEVSFDSRVYRSFEMRINGTIRFSHRISYFQTKIAMRNFRKKFPTLMIRTEFQEEYNNIMQLKGNKELKKKIKELKERLDKNILKYMCKTSLIFMGYMLTILLFSLLRYTSNFILDKNKKLIKEIDFITENEMKIA